jgi:hypothetical protein
MSPDRIDTLSRRLAQPASRRRLLALVGVGAASTTLTAAGLNDALAKKKNKGGGKGKGNKGDTANIGPFNTMTGIPLSAHQKGRNFKGTLDIVRFEERSGSVVAIGTITGKVTGKGKGNKPVTQENVVLPVSFAPPVQTQSANGVQAQATCQILDLTLGPIDLNLLGLRLQVNQIHIQLTATQGALLGDLLCAIANLLNGGILGQILNQLLGLLNQLLTLPGI